MKIKSLLLVVLLVSVFAALAAADQWVLDPLHSKIEFSANSRLVKAEGQFHKFTVQAEVNDKALENSKLAVTIDIASIDTANERRDNHLKTKDFFDVQTYPSATIEIRSIKKASATEYEASADFTMHGVTKSVTLPITVTSFEGGVLRFKGVTTVSRKDFAIGTDTTGIVNAANPIDDQVAIRYEVDLRKPTARSAANNAR